jgi:hypothetical protein
MLAPGRQGSVVFAGIWKFLVNVSYPAGFCPRTINNGLERSNKGHALGSSLILSVKLVLDKGYHSSDVLVPKPERSAIVPPQQPTLHLLAGFFGAMDSFGLPSCSTLSRDKWRWWDLVRSVLFSPGG